MRKTFVISESEKKQIRKMYGLISEGREQVEEIYTYTIEYIDKPGCDGIAEDVKNMNDAVQRGELKISDKAAETLKSNSNKVGMLSFACNPGKNMMKETLESNINDQSSYPDMIASACWMSKNSSRYTKNLNICSQPVNSSETQIQTTNLSNAPVNVKDQTPVSDGNQNPLWGRDSSESGSERRFNF
jgi:hypothetical protein